MGREGFTTGGQRQTGLKGPIVSFDVPRRHFRPAEELKLFQARTARFLQPLADTLNLVWKSRFFDNPFPGVRPFPESPLRSESRARAFLATRRFPPAAQGIINAS